MVRLGKTEKQAMSYLHMAGSVLNHLLKISQRCTVIKSSFLLYTSRFNDFVLPDVYRRGRNLVKVLSTDAGEAENSGRSRVISRARRRGGARPGGRQVTQLEVLVIRGSPRQMVYHIRG